MPRNPPTFLNLPLELRLDIYSYLLILPPPPPPETQQPIYRCSRVFTSSSTGSTTTTKPDEAKLHPQILRVCSQTYREAAPVLYTRNTFSAHPTLLTSHATLLRCYNNNNNNRWRRPNQHHHDQQTQLHQPIPSTTTRRRSEKERGGSSYHYLPTPYRLRLPAGHAAQLASIRRWHIRVRLDAAPSWTPEAVAAAFSGADELTIEVWRAGSFVPSSATTTTTTTNSDTNSGETPAAADEVTIVPSALRAFEGVRGVRRARVVGENNTTWSSSSDGGETVMVKKLEGYVEWLVGRMMSSSSSSSTGLEGVGNADSCKTWFGDGGSMMETRERLVAVWA
ncbi:hypothetical protein VTJ04DRAFT_6484 [Mycothermus thermophilus]|uniref:uncharacterized protein n=1 Tax=Humicola insolens TaxID=85995 RepID=UPI003742A2FE